MEEARTARRVGRRASRLLAVTAMISALCLGMATAAYADVTRVTGSAYGVSVNLTTLLGPTAVIAPQPTVTLPPAGSPPLTYASTTPVFLPGLLSTGAINVATEGALGPNGYVKSGNEVHGIAIAGLLQIDAIGSECKSTAAGSTAHTAIGNIESRGQKLVVADAPNTTLTVPGLGVLHVNEQKVTGSGASTSITVNALRLELSVLGLAGAEVVLGHAVCGVGSA
jgi:hypothetical protein